jgi:hypothetical protein
MGRKIDRIAFTLLLAAAFYLFFAGTLGSIPAAAAFTFVTMICLKKLVSGIPAGRFGRRRRARRAAEERLEKLAFSDMSEARREIEQLIKSAYPDEAAGLAITIILRHPSGAPVSADDVMNEWKRRRGSDRTVIASPAKADDGARRLAENLKAPRVQLLDGPRLISLMAAGTTEIPKPSQTTGRRLRGRWESFRRAAGRARAGKCLAMGAVFCLMFMLTGAAAYLAAGTILFFIAGVAIKNRAHPRMLFTE